ncbi:hypothetical protein BDK51DRAFT_4712, partial [Blyttiomyces helicus]
SNWFLGADFDKIRRSDVRVWLSWALFDDHVETLTRAESAEIEELLPIIEDSLQHRFPNEEQDEGRDVQSAVQCMRLTLDPMRAVQRPLVYYMAIAGVDVAANAALRSHGYRRRDLEVDGRRHLFTYRPAQGPTPKGALPLVFVHGIGIGFAHYLPLLAKLPTNIPIYLLEWPHVSMKVEEEVPRIPDTVSALSAMLRADGHNRACFSGHSLGTIAISWMLRDPVAAPLVASTVLIDPVSFLLFDPTVACSFLYREPASVLELLMNYFVSRELYIAHTLFRHFDWSHNIIFLNDLPLEGTNTVILSGSDHIVPSRRVRNYLIAE